MNTQNDYNEEFDRLRRNRVEVSFYKYGPARDKFGGGRVDALETAERCIEAFKKDKNTKHLLDAANYLMFRYTYPSSGKISIQRSVALKQKRGIE